MPELRTGGSNTDMVSSAIKYDSTKRRPLRTPHLLELSVRRLEQPDPHQHIYCIVGYRCAQPAIWQSKADALAVLLLCSI